MSVNKFMHPRNIYRTPPDFTKLAKTYEDFSQISKLDLNGKVSIDFKDPCSLRVLTKCLLKSDFGLDVVIPEDKLVPTLPLRLNYILWLEDLLDAIKRRDNIRGIDIGTGACAIYPLLSASKNKWKMLGTETDQESLDKAQENVNRNNLQNLIQLVKNTTTSLIEFLFSNGCNEKYDFCMCNPPFYSNIQELCESRSPARLPPKNGFTGSPHELITEGGEIAFCRKLIQESKLYKDKIIVFTTMVGHKYSLKELAQDLKYEGIEFTTTEFCQGRVTRWGLAWTFQKFQISVLVPGREKSRKKNIPILYNLPELPNIPYTFENIHKKMLTMLQDLKIEYNVLNKRGNSVALNVKALENTWSNQRRKRRMIKLKQDAAKRVKLENIGDDTAEKSTETNKEINNQNKSSEEILVEQQSKEGIESTNQFHETTMNTTIDDKVEVKMVSNTSEPNHNMDCGSEYSGVKSNETVCHVHAFLKIFKQDNNFTLSIEYLDGSAGKEGVHQIMQYIKNNWK